MGVEHDFHYIDISFEPGKLGKLGNMNPTSVLIYHLDSVMYAIPLANVDRVTRAVEITTVAELDHKCNILGVINVHGAIVPVINTRRMLGLVERTLSIDDVFIIADSGQRKVALVVEGVDQLVTIDEAHLTQAHSVLPEFPHLKGVARMAEGLVLIHDLEACLSAGDAAAIDTALEMAQPTATHGVAA